MLPVVAVFALAAAPPPAVQLARLADLYRAYDLPLPPKDAKLVREVPKATAFGTNPPRIGFLLSARTPTTYGEVLFECGTAIHYPDITSEIQPDPKAINPSEVSLMTVLHMHLRGWHELALEVYSRGGNWKDWQPADQLASRAFDYWQWRFFWKETDRAVVARRFALILNGQPEAVGKEGRQWYAELLLSLKPTGAKPGSVEAAIDELIDASGGGFGCYDPRYYAVAARGFDAVPALIEHLTDNRPTRFHSDGGGGFGPGRPYRVKHLASDILMGFMGDDFVHDEDEEETMDKDGVVRAKDVNRWWAKAAKEGEEAYTIRRVLGRDDDDWFPNRHLLVVIQHKYPHRLPELFYILLADRQEMDLREMAEAVAEATLPKEKKRELFAAATDSKNAEWRRIGRDHLRVVDPDEFHKRLLGLLATLAATHTSDYAHTSPEAEFAEEVKTATDPKVWTAAEKYMRAADVGLRVEWLKRMGAEDRPADTRPRRVALLAAFLTDDDVRDLKKLPSYYPNSWAGYPDFRKIEVRNFAALELGRMLDLKAKPKADWTADEWKAFRERMATLAKEVK